MKKEVLVVVDMQNDFIDGTLGTKEAVEIVPIVTEYVKGFNGELFFTRDTHEDNYLDTQEGKNLPVKHCIRGSKGWEICPQLMEYTKNAVVVDKPTFGSLALAEKLADLARTEEIEKIILVGLCTDICVISNAMLIKAALPEVKICVIANACAGVSVETHKNALEAMKLCQIEVVE